MSVSMKKMLVIGAATAAGWGSAAHAEVKVGVDPSANWLGYMNVFELPSNGGGYVFGSGWGTADLSASFNAGVLTMRPNTNIDRDVPLDTPFWWQDASGTSPGNKNMYAAFYQESGDIDGQLVTFSGTVLGNNLVAPYGAQVFIKDFVSDYSSNTSVFLPLTPGPFSISLQTTGDDHHIQFGFEVSGPNARLAQVNSLGALTIKAVANAPSQPGDYNGDGFVDSADYTVWADHFGQTGAGVPGDGNNDGSVDSADYTVWADHFGQGTPHGALVPEPAGMALGLVGAPLLLRRRR